MSNHRERRRPPLATEVFDPITKPATDDPQPTIAPQSPAIDARSIARLQRTAGNGAVAALLQGTVQRAFKEDLLNQPYATVHTKLCDAYENVPPAWRIQQLMNDHNEYKSLGDLAEALGLAITARPKAGTSIHPTLTQGAGNDATAVREAQMKLASSPGGPKSLASDGIFGPLTEAAARAFQKRNRCPETGVIDAATWKLLDAQGKSSVGRVERQWEQNILATPGEAGYLAAMTSKYSYEITATEIHVKVGINFVADSTHPPADLGAVVSKWKGRILGRWNLFKAEKSDGSASRNVVFEIVPSGGNTVNVIDAMVGSDAGNWSVPDNENDNGPAHEFGHMIGLEDEYRRDINDYTRLHPATSKTGVASAKGGFYGGEQYTNETSMMGMGALSGHADKAADPEPRHVREFVRYVERFLGGQWVAKKR